MQTFRYFEQDAGTYNLKIQKGLLFGIALLCLAGLTATLVYGTTKGAYVGAFFLGIFVVIGILRTTGRISFNTATRQITTQSFFFSAERTYSFDDFDHFLVVKNTSLFIPLNISAMMILYPNGKEKRILLRQSFFVAKPLQRLTDELADIMALPR